MSSCPTNVLIIYQIIRVYLPIVYHMYPKYIQNITFNMSFQLSKVYNRFSHYNYGNSVKYA